METGQDAGVWGGTSEDEAAGPSSGAPNRARVRASV